MNLWLRCSGEAGGEMLLVSARCECGDGPTSLGRAGEEAPGGEDQLTVVIVVRRAAHRQGLHQGQSL